MTIHLKRARRALGNLRTEDFELPSDGRTLGQVLGQHYHPEWPEGTQVSATLDGKPAEVEDLAKPLRGDVWVTMAPKVAGLEIGTLLLIAAINAVLSVALNLIIDRLFLHKRRAPQRGDDESPTYTHSGMQTASGPGFRVPLAWGLIDLPGHVVSSDYRTVGGTEYLEQTIVLCEGRIEAIGGITGGLRGEADGLGSLDPFTIPPLDIPADFRVNGNTLDKGECEMSLRMGEILQSPMKGFAVPSTPTNTDGPLDDQNSLATVEGLDLAAEDFSARITFPSGLYKLQGNGTAVPYPVSFQIWWESPTTSSIFQTYTVDVPARRSAFAHNIETKNEIPFVGAGPFTVKVKRLTAAGNPNDTVSSAALTTVTTHKNIDIAYAGRAAFSVRMRATERTAQGQPQYRARVKAKRVRVWDATHGFSSELWELPTSGVFSGIWQYPPGRNPAWIALDMILSTKALGHFVDVADVDLPAFRDWADFCDEHAAVPAGLEANCQCDIVVDSPTRAIEALRMVFTAGRAGLIKVGNLWTVTYQYRDAHGRGTNSVPAKGGGSFNIPDHVFDTSSVDPQSVRMRRLNNRVRANVLHFSILNAQRGYEPDDIRVEDPTVLQTLATAHLPVLPIARKIEYRGVTRPTQARRDGLLMHAIAKAAEWELEFTTGIQGLPVLPGQLLAFEFDAARYTLDEQHYGWRTTLDVTASSFLFLDHDVTITSTPAWVAAVPQTDGTVVVVGLSAGTYLAGTPIPTTSPLTYAKGINVALGHSAKTWRLFEVVSVSTESDMRTHIGCIDWRQEAYDPPSTSLLGYDGSSYAAAWDSPSAEVPSVPSARFVRLPTGGGHALEWDRSEDFGTRPVRVYVRSLGTSDWVLRAETRDARLELEGAAPGETYQVALSQQDASGSFQAPTAAAQFTVTVPEFSDVPTPPVASLVASVHGQGVALRWAPLDHKDVVGYELRRGTHWHGAHALLRTTSPGAYLEDQPAGTCTIHVRAMFRGGLYSGSSATAAVTFASNNRVELASVTDLVASASGTHSGTAYDGANLRLGLSGDACQGTYTASEVDLGSVTFALWSVLADFHERESWLATDWATVSGSDLKWWDVFGRPASSALPGADFDVLANAWTDPATNPNRTGPGFLGAVGTHTRVKVECRWDTTGAGAWTAWRDARPQWFAAQKMQVRLVLERRGVRYQALVTSLTIKVHV